MSGSVDSRPRLAVLSLAIAIALVPAVMPRQMLAEPSEENAGKVFTFTRLAGSEGGAGSVDGAGTSARFNHPAGVAADRGGNMYLADSGNHTIRRIATDGAVTTVAGLAGESGSRDGRDARFSSPTGVAIDPRGVLYVADSENHTIRTISPGGTVSTLAGEPGVFGGNDGRGREARFNSPQSVAVDGEGNVYVADTASYTIRRISRSGEVSTLAGSAGQSGAVDGTGSEARFGLPTGLALAADGNLYVADNFDHTIRRVTLGGVVTTFAGLSEQNGVADGTGSAARFFYPRGVLADADGNLYVADGGSDALRKITPSGMVTTLATNVSGNPFVFGLPWGMAIDLDGNILVSDNRGQMIRKVSPTEVSTFAGLPARLGYVDAAGGDARFAGLGGIAVDPAGNVYVADGNNSAIRKIDAGGVVTTLAGGNYGSFDGQGLSAGFTYPIGAALDNGGSLYVTDSHAIRKILPTRVVITIAGNPDQSGSVDGFPTNARFEMPYGVAADGTGNVFVADTGNHTIRKISASNVSTVAGVAGESGSEDGTGNEARFSRPTGIAVDAGGNIYVMDSGNGTVRKISPGGVVTTLAGSPGLLGSVDGTGADAWFGYSEGLAVDSLGNVYVTEANDATIRMVSPEGVVTTVGGRAGFEGNLEASGSEARFGYPRGIAVGPDGALYVASARSGNVMVGREASATVATIDSSAGKPGETRVLSTSDDTATSWAWSVIRRPGGSTAALSSSDVRTPTFTPDEPGLYVFRLEAGDGAASRISTVSFRAEERLRPARH